MKGLFAEAYMCQAYFSWYNLEQGLHCHDYITAFQYVEVLDRLWRTTDRNGG